MYRHDLKDIERRFTKYAAVALAAAAVENVLGDGNALGDLHGHVRAMVDDFWRLIAEPVVQGKTKMTEAEVRALPSSRLYLHTRALGETCSQLRSVHDAHRKAADLAGGAFANLLFMVWQLESVEAILNPGKPRVVPEDIAETNWSALVDGLEQLAKAARDPDRAFEWQQQTIARLAQDHPYAPRAIGTVVPRAYFGLAAAAMPAAPALPALETAHRLRREEVEDRFTEYALIALATATLEQLLPAAPSDLAPVLSTLIEDLWSWQAAPKPQGRSGMSKTEAATLPAARFHARLTQLPSQPARLVGIVRSAILFITWVMDAIERRMNPGKPFLFGDEDELEDDFGVLLDLLEQAVEASRDPEAMLAWERQTVLRLRTQYPADRDTPNLTLGEPVTRAAFQNATQ